MNDPRSLGHLSKSNLDYAKDQLQAVIMQMGQHQDHFSQMDLALMTSITSKSSIETKNEISHIPSQFSASESQHETEI